MVKNKTQKNEFMKIQYEKFLDSNEKTFKEFMLKRQRVNRELKFIEFLSFKKQINSQLEKFIFSGVASSITPYNFYESIYKGNLQETGKFRDGAYNAILCIMNGKKNRQYMVKQNLGILNFAWKRFEIQQEALFEKIAKFNLDWTHPEFLNLHLDDWLDTKKRDFVIISSCDYLGKKKHLSKVRNCYELVIDVDYCHTNTLNQIVKYCDNGFLPPPTFFVFSGTGFHLHYVFKKPISVENKINGQILNDIKKCLTQFWWQAGTTKRDVKIQYQTISQSFRVVGTFTKQGFETQGFKFREGKEYSIDEFVNFQRDYKGFKEAARVENWERLSYKQGWEDVKALYPNWAEMIERKEREKEEGKPKFKEKEKKPKKFDYNPFERIYNWFLRRLTEPNKEGEYEVTEGHRYHCIQCLACFARKCGVNFERLQRDAHSLHSLFNELGESEFAKEEIDLALRIYKEPYARRMSANYLSKLSGIKFEKKEKKGYTNSQALQLANLARKLKNEKRWKENRERREKEAQERKKRREERERIRKEQKEAKIAKEELLNSKMAIIKPKFKRKQKLNSRQRANREKKRARLKELEF